jgi:hypothetical protein
MRCSAVGVKSGKPCRAAAVNGATVCRMHGAQAPQVKAKAAVRAELMNWVLGEPKDDPAETLLRLITQSRHRADAYAAELGRASAQYETLQEALVGDSMITGMDGKVHKAGEYIRGLVVLEAQERDRCANFCTKAIAAGIAERQVIIAEKQASVFAEFVRSLIEAPELGLSVNQREVALVVASRELRALSAA